MKTLATKLTPLLAALVLAACSRVPELGAPRIEIPAAFKEAPAPLQSADGARWKPAQPAESRARGEWWLAFDDPALTALVHEATRANASLAVAAARVKQARALAGVAQAQRGVQLGA
ncbi:RND transporter, partial [Massilia glaciei]